MLTLTRNDAKRLRSMLRATLLDQEPKGRWPTLVLQGTAKGTTVYAQKGDLALRWTLSQAPASGEIAFPSTLLADLEAMADDPVGLQPVEAGRGRATWQENGIPRHVPFDTVEAGSLASFPTPSTELIPAELELLPALKEAAKTAAKSDTRVSLSRIQLRGKRGEVVATDGRQLLLHRGFRFPFSADVLIPSLKLFTRKPDWQGETVLIGTSPSHFFLESGGWELALGLDRHSRYPDVGKVLPAKGSAKTRLLLDQSDAGFLLETLPKLSHDRTEPVPLTVHLQTHPVVRSHGESDGAAVEIELSRSSIEGTEQRVCLNRTNLVRLLELGFRQINCSQPNQALWSEDADRLYLFMPIEPSPVVDPKSRATRVQTASQSLSSNTVQPERRKQPMPLPSRNGHSQHPRETSSPEPTLDELISQADELRRTHQEAGTKLAKFISALKGYRKQNRTLRQAVASIKGLNLGG